MTAGTPAWTDEDGARRATKLLGETFGGAPDGVWASPGRVNLIGEHLDYNGGSVLPMALPHSTFVAFRRRDDDVIRLASPDAEPTIWSGRLADLAPDGAAPLWVRYAGGPAWVLARDAEITGFDAAIVSCVPLGAGLSSSAAIECSMALALAATHHLDADRAALAAACVRAENEVVGAPTGGMDQAASLRCTAGHALHLDCVTGEVEQVLFDLAPHGLALLVIDTCAKHALVDGQYAARRATCEAVAAREGVATLAQLLDPDATLARLSDPTEQRYVRHVVTEIARVAEFVDLLAAGRYADLGPVLDASHASLRDDYAVSCPELDLATESARDAGALGARMTGGGFGGSAIALVPATQVAAVSASVEAAFATQGWTPPVIHTALASAGGRAVSA